MLPGNKSPAATMYSPEPGDQSSQGPLPLRPTPQCLLTPPASSEITMEIALVRVPPHCSQRDVPYKGTCFFGMAESSSHLRGS